MASFLSWNNKALIPCKRVQDLDTSQSRSEGPMKKSPLNNLVKIKLMGKQNHCGCLLETTSQHFLPQKILSLFPPPAPQAKQGSCLSPPALGFTVQSLSPLQLQWNMKSHIPPETQPRGRKVSKIWILNSQVESGQRPHRTSLLRRQPSSLRCNRGLCAKGVSTSRKTPYP